MQSRLCKRTGGNVCICCRQGNDLVAVAVSAIHGGAQQLGFTQGQRGSGGRRLHQRWHGVGFDADRQRARQTADAVRVQRPYMQVVAAIRQGGKACLLALYLCIAQHLVALRIAADAHQPALCLWHGRQRDIQPLRVFIQAGQGLCTGRGQQCRDRAGLAIGRHGHAKVRVERLHGGLSAGQRLHGHLALQYSGCGAAVGLQLHVKAGAAHTGGSNGRAYVQMALGIRLAGHLYIYTALLQFEDGLQAARTATAAQLAQLHGGSSAHLNQAAVCQLDGDECIGRELQLVTFLERHARLHRHGGCGAAVAQLGTALHKVHRSRSLAHQPHGHFQHGAGLQAVRAAHLVVALQGLPERGIAQIALGNLGQRVASHDAVGNDLLRLRRLLRSSRQHQGAAQGHGAGQCGNAEGSAWEHGSSRKCGVALARVAVQAVAQTVDRSNGIRIAGPQLQDLPQAGHMGVQRTRQHFGVLAPDRLTQVVA